MWLQQVNLVECKRTVRTMAGKQHEKEESKLDKLKHFFGVKGSSTVKVAGGSGSRRSSVKEYVLDPHVTQVC